MKESTRNIIIILAVILFGLLIWGSIGANEAKAVGISCDIGLFQEKLCFKWHQNEIGALQEAWNNLQGK